MQIASLDKVCDMRFKARTHVRDTLTPDTMREALATFLPCPCTKRYTAIVLLPEAGLLSRLWPSKPSTSVLAACGLGLAVAGVLAFAWSRRR